MKNSLDALRVLTAWHGFNTVSTWTPGVWSVQRCRWTDIWVLQGRVIHYEIDVFLPFQSSNLQRNQWQQAAHVSVSPVPWSRVLTEACYSSVTIPRYNLTHPGSTSPVEVSGGNSWRNSWCNSTKSTLQPAVVVQTGGLWKSSLVHPCAGWMVMDTFLHKDIDWTRRTGYQNLQVWFVIASLHNLGLRAPWKFKIGILFSFFQ